MVAALKLEQFSIPTTVFLEETMEKPSMDEVLLYAKPMVWKWIGKLASKVPKEQQEEIAQEAYIRLIKKYPEIEADQGWKSLVYNHCRGSVLDYLKHGKGFQEEKWSLRKPEEVGDVNVGKIFNRVSLYDVNEEELSIDQILGKNGAFNLDIDKIEINWDLVARMASSDESLHAFAKSIRGITLDKMAPVFGVKIARAGQLVQAFVDRFDDPEHADCPWFKQCCYALGICELLGLPKIDQSIIMGFSIGWTLDPVDLDSLTPAHYILEMESQTEMDFM